MERPSDSGLRDELLERLVYFPVGLASALIGAAPTAAETGKRLVSGQVKTAEFLGKMSFEYAKQRYPGPEDLLRDLTGVASGVLRTRLGPLGALVHELISSGTGSDVSQDSESVGQPLIASVPRTVGGIDDYESLTASQAISHFESLNDLQLSAVEIYELEHRRRRTILARISQIREDRSQGGAPLA